MKTILIGDTTEKKIRVKDLLKRQALDVTEADCEPLPDVLVKDPARRLVVACIEDQDGPALEACRSIRYKADAGPVFIVALADENTPIDENETGAEPLVDGILRQPVTEEDLTVIVRTGLRSLGLEKRLREADLRIRTLSVTDPLTGCYSRQYLEEHLPHEIKRAARYGRSLSVIACDIDRLDAINTVWGGGMGDRALSETAALLQNSIRRHIDWVSRSDEDGFAIVLPETGPGGALSLIERLRDRIDALQWEKEGAALRVTASFGYAGFSAGWSGAGDLQAPGLLNRAEAFLKAAQRAGLNRFAGGSLEEGVDREAV